MNAPWPRPVAETSKTVTLRKRDWKALLARLEDLEDLAAIAERLAYEEQVGKEVARRDYLTGDEMKRILDDESPVKVWREKRGLTQRELAEQAGSQLRLSRGDRDRQEAGQRGGIAEAIARTGDPDGESTVASGVSGGCGHGRALDGPSS